MMKELIELKILRTNRGAPIIHRDFSSALIINDEIALITIYMRSKWCKLEMTGSDSNGKLTLFLTASEHSLHLANVAIDEPTMIELPQFCGWRIFSADYTFRYELNLVLIKSIDIFDLNKLSPRIEAIDPFPVKGQQGFFNVEFTR